VHNRGAQQLAQRLASRTTLMRTSCRHMHTERSATVMQCKDIGNKGRAEGAKELDDVVVK